VVPAGVLGDEEPLSQHEQYYQRLLADDTEEATELIEKMLPERNTVDVCDTVLLPALLLARAEWQKGELSEVKYLSVREDLKDQIEGLEEEDKLKGAEGGSRRGLLPTIQRKVVCLPINEESEIGAMALCYLCRRTGYSARTLNPKLLVGEMIEQSVGVADVAVVVTLPSHALRRARALCRQCFGDRTAWRRLH